MIDQMKIESAFLVSLACIQLYACNSNVQNQRAGNIDNTVSTDTMKLKLTVGSSVFRATLHNNETATAFAAMLPLTINMSELNGNEKYYDLLSKLPANASNPGTIQAGDLMLYGTNTVVLFYKSFSTSYSYTRLGRIDDPSGLAIALDPGDVTIKFELE
jgi:hypothetical protein